MQIAVERKEPIMEQYRKLALRLRGLAVFRRLLDDPAVAELLRLLEAQTPKEIAAHWAGLASTLYEADQEQADLSDYLLSAVLADENCYMLRRAQGKSVDPLLEGCVREELNLFSEVAALSSGALRKEMDWEGFLPEWSGKKCDFWKIYQERMEQIPLYGYGVYARYHTFVLKDGIVTPVRHPDETSLDQLSGYLTERRQVLDNTAALLRGRPAANILLYGDAGTGKSSTVKAVANRYCREGLRLIELKKDQLHQLPALMDSLSRNPLKFILFIDDLSFTRDDSDFSALKAVLEGTVAAKGSNTVIYATSNRRHLVRESFADRAGDDVHINDTMQELTSLSDRFGLTITFLRPDKKQYMQIVCDLAKRYNLTLSDEELFQEANAFAVRRGGYSPRTARQLVEILSASE